MNFNQTYTLETLTPRQRQVAMLVPDGFTNRQIGQKLGVCESVVKNYLKEIYDRLGVWTRLELAIHIVQREEMQYDA